MASVLAFNKAVIAGVTVTTAEFVNGTGRYVEQGFDVEVTVANGRIMRVRKAIKRNAEFQAYAQREALRSAQGLGVTIALYLNSTLVSTFTGAVTIAGYDEDQMVTSIKILGNPITANP